MQLNEQEIEIIKELIADHGSDCPYLDSDRLRPLAEKLGVWEPEKPLTEEELKRREEWANSPYGKIMSEMLTRVNKNIVDNLLNNNMFYDDKLWNKKEYKIGTTLKIRMPNNYQVKVK